MVERKRPPAAKPGCAFPNDDILKLGEELQIRATPTIYFADGTREEGSIPPEALEEKLDSIK